MRKVAVELFWLTHLFYKVTTVARNLSGPSGDPAIAQSFDQEAAAVSLFWDFFLSFNGEMLTCMPRRS